MIRGKKDLMGHIRSDRMYLKHIRYEYKNNEKYLIKKPHGTVDNAFSESYYETIRQEIESFDKVIQKLCQIIDSNFKVDVKVLPNGKLDTEHLRIQVSRSFSLRGSNKPQALMVHDALYNVLIFADCINDVHLYSTNYKLSHCEIFMVADVEDLEYMADNISVPEKCFQQWMHAIKDFEQYAEKQYACSMNIACDEGELCFESRIYALSQREFVTCL